MAHPTQWGMKFHEFPIGTKVYEPAPMGFTSTYVPAGKLTGTLQTYLNKEEEQSEVTLVRQEKIYVDGKLTNSVYIKPKDSIYYNKPAEIIVKNTKINLKTIIIPNVLMIIIAIAGFVIYKKKH